MLDKNKYFTGRNGVRFAYTVNAENNAIITYIGMTKEGVVEIPSNIGLHKVVKVIPSIYNPALIKELIIPGTIEEMGMSAFANFCKSL